MANTTHPVQLTAPFYADKAQGGLHRYLDPDFVNHFRHEVSVAADALRTPLATTRGHAHPVLALPLHRSFHVFCCEVVCDRLGSPALDPARIESAGFAIRRIGGDEEMAWMLEDGVAIGWQPLVARDRDPDLRRRIASLGIGRRRNGGVAIASSDLGEATHPLHPFAIRDADGRNHTLLFGYVPLGGSYYRLEPPTAEGDNTMREFLDEAARALPWPFGYRDVAVKRGRRWPAGERIEIAAGGVPGWPLFELLRVLVGRYHLGDEGIEENGALLALCRRLAFEPGPTLGDYLAECAALGGDNPLVAWLADGEARRELPGAVPGALPRAGNAHPVGELAISAADAQELRELLGQRLQVKVSESAREIPLPRFGQDEDDVFRIVPFVRSRDDCGCVHIHWGDDAACSIAFRVASPHDPDASRPSLVQMPSIGDLKRGMARGVSMLTPADTFAMISAIKLGKGAGPDAVPEDKPAGGGGGLQWICSFSLPVVTLVAMILLMIMVSVLNLLFFWLPWVRVCLPFPKIGKKGGP